MTKDEFKARFEALEQQKKMLFSQYIDANKKFNVGDKIQVVTKSKSKPEFYWVQGFGVGGFNYDIMMFVCKTKKSSKVFNPNNRGSTLFTYPTMEIKLVEK